MKSSNFGTKLQGISENIGGFYDGIRRYIPIWAAIPLIVVHFILEIIVLVALWALWDGFTNIEWTVSHIWTAIIGVLLIALGIFWHRSKNAKNRKF
jgi:cadmium resistance protein CadD (predicted permease)